jgi:hypothetical protein
MTDCFSIGCVQLAQADREKILENQSNSLVKFFKNLAVEPLWNLACAAHWLEPPRNFFPASCDPFRFASASGPPPIEGLGSGDAQPNIN